jgi:hypothetical protein
MKKFLNAVLPETDFTDEIICSELEDRHNYQWLKKIQQKAEFIF